MATSPTKKINIATYFEILIVKLHVFYILIMHIKFRVNRMLFTIRCIKFLFISNFRLQKLKI